MNKQSNDKSPESILDDLKAMVCEQSREQKAPASLETKTFAIKAAAAPDAKGSFEGMVSPYGGEPDAAGDVIMPGSYSKTLADKGPDRILLWSHDQSQPIGKVSLFSKENGLYCKGRIELGIEKGKEAYELIKNGVVDGLSIGFRTVQSHFGEDGCPRFLDEICLYEISVVSLPAARAARISSIKSRQEKTLNSQLVDQYKAVQRICNGEGGVLHLDRKSLDSSAGVATTGVLRIDRIPEITPGPRQRLFLRDVLAARGTDKQIIDYAKVSSAMNIASPQTEGSDKGQNDASLTSASERIRTLATWVTTTRQFIDDLPELEAFLRDELTYRVRLLEEFQMLTGDGTGQNLHGLIPQASSLDTSQLGSSWTKLDIISEAIWQLENAYELTATFLVIHPTDYKYIRGLRNSAGQYVGGFPFSQSETVQNRPRIFGLDPIVTVNIASGTFLVGSGSPVAAEIRDRDSVKVEFGPCHSDYFIKNKIAVLAEERVALVLKRPGSFITGSFTESPA